MIKKKHILITGANGQLGMEFRSLEISYPQFSFFFASRDILSISETSEVDKYIVNNKIDCCINCAAYTAVDKAETEKEEAFQINAIAAGNLAEVCKKYNCLFIHISTDYVFNGEAAQPYSELSAVAPLNVYGASKLKGEEGVLRNNPQSLIIRTSWVYSTFGKNFVKTMIRLMEEKESISVVDDQQGCPTYAKDLAGTILQLIAENDQPAPGIYHYCNSGAISWYEFAMGIKELTNSKCNVQPVPTTAYPTAAKRPQYTVMDTSKITAQFHLKISDWKTSLGKCISELNI